VTSSKRRGCGDHERIKLNTAASEGQDDVQYTGEAQVPTPSEAAQGQSSWVLERMGSVSTWGGLLNCLPGLDMREGCGDSGNDDGRNGAHRTRNLWSGCGVEIGGKGPWGDRGWV
jgi:hypothetical protein